MRHDVGKVSECYATIQANINELILDTLSYA